MGRLRRWLLVGAALVVGGLAALTSYSWMQARVARELRRSATAGGGVSLVVAARDVQRAARLTAEDVAVVKMPQGFTLAGATQRPEQAVGRISRSRLYAGEPILDAKLEPAQGRPGIEAAIPEGLRAMTVKADDVIGLAGFALPGSRVDVVAVIKPAHSAEPSARLVVQDVEVLAADQGIEPGDGKPRQATSITLLVTPRQAESLALVATQGHLRLVLRGPADRGIAVTPGIDSTVLLSRPAPPAAPPPPAATSPASASSSSSKAKRTVRRRVKPEPEPVEVAAAPVQQVETIENDHRQKVTLQRESGAAARAPSRRGRTP